MWPLKQWNSDLWLAATPALLEEVQGVGVCGHSRVSSNVEVVAVITVGVVSQLHGFCSLWGHLCTYLLLCLPLFFPLPFSVSNKARDMASGLASMATLFKNKRVSSDSSATANVWAQFVSSPDHTGGVRDKLSVSPVNYFVWIIWWWLNGYVVNTVPEFMNVACHTAKDLWTLGKWNGM